MLKHGGNLRQAADEYGIPLDEWLDLSTGINPDGWPVPETPASIWQYLPQELDGLEQAARAFYQADRLLPVAGSQAAIQALPRLRPAGTVGVLSLAYAEHEYNWRRGGHTVSHLAVHEIDKALPRLDALVLVNPNNPTGERFPIRQLLDWHRTLAERGGWLVVDEAFMDVEPQFSLSPYATRPGLVVLRSLGKFFGLAGVRCGFVLSDKALLDRLQGYLGPWHISGPARWVASQALLDVDWQSGMRPRLLEQAGRLKRLLNCYHLQPDGGTGLFQWVKHEKAKMIQASLAQQGVWVRYFDQPASLRFGLPGTEQAWQRLDAALQTSVNEIGKRENTDESMASQ